MDIVIKDICKSYAGKLVLDHITLTLPENKITCIMGPSGKGKTTLIHILMDLVKADYGQISGMDGRRISAVFQEDRLCEGMDVISNVRIVCGKRTTESEIEKEFQALRLTDYRGKPVNKLSGGMKRRVAIARAIMADAEVYIMDEPFKGLDEELKEQVIIHVKQKLKGKTVIIVTHDKLDAVLLDAQVVPLGEKVNIV